MLWIDSYGCRLIVMAVGTKWRVKLPTEDKLRRSFLLFLWLFARLFRWFRKLFIFIFVPLLLVGSLPLFELLLFLHYVSFLVHVVYDFQSGDVLEKPTAVVGFLSHRVLGEINFSQLFEFDEGLESVERRNLVAGAADLVKGGDCGEYGDDGVGESE